MLFKGIDWVTSAEVEIDLRVNVRSRETTITCGGVVSQVSTAAGTFKLLRESGINITDKERSLVEGWFLMDHALVEERSGG